MSIRDKNKEVISYIKKEYLKKENDWHLGFSGGKDSSASLKLIYSAVRELDYYHKKIYVLFCDTGVENPVISQYVYDLFDKLQKENDAENLPFTFTILKPKLSDRFFVKVIGKGYPTPTNIFRWCTKKLRVDPINEFIKSKKNSFVILGVRLNESQQRDRTINKYKLEEKFLLKQNNSVNRIIFSPILYHDLEEVWMTINSLKYPISLNALEIRNIYKDAESDCTSIRLKNQACGSSRFGCWTCTVVRKDKSIANLISNGYDQLERMHEFRNWIAEFRDNLNYRCKYRRNGQKSLGPITLEGRKVILEKLLKVQDESNFNLIDKEEIDLIYELWEKDKKSSNYREK